MASLQEGTGMNYRYELCASGFYIKPPFENAYNLEKLYKISREVENYDPFLFRYFDDGTDNLTFLNEISNEIKQHHKQFENRYFLPNVILEDGTLWIYFIYIWDMKYRKYVAFAAWPLLKGETLPPQLLWNGKLIDIEGNYD